MLAKDGVVTCDENSCFELGTKMVVVGFVDCTILVIDGFDDLEKIRKEIHIIK